MLRTICPKCERDQGFCECWRPSMPTTFRIIREGDRVVVSGSVKGQPFREEMTPRQILSAWQDLNEAVRQIALPVVQATPRAQG